ncbi:MAG: hypothetical protein AB1374_02110 [Bacillota bacterium]
MIILKYTVAWLPMVVIAVLNGSIREAGYKKFLGELSAHQLSTATEMLCLRSGDIVEMVIYRERG